MYCQFVKFIKSARQTLNLAAIKLIWCDHNNTDGLVAAEGGQDWSDHSRRIDLAIYIGPTKTVKI